MSLVATRPTSITQVYSFLLYPSGVPTDVSIGTSEESKQHSKDVLDQQYNGGEIEKDSGDKNPNNVAGGLKA